jgi:hypothetical protein
MIARAAILAILDDLGAREETLLGFIDAKIEGGYRTFARMRAAEEMPDGRARSILFLFLSYRLDEALHEVFRTLALLQKGSRMQFILESCRHRDEAAREGGIEALENVLSPDLARRLLPLVEDLPLELKLRAGERCFDLPRPDLAGMLMAMLDSPDKAEVWCGLLCAGDARARNVPLPAELLARAAEREKALGVEGGTTVEDLMEKVLTLKGVPIFSHLQFKELLAIASISRTESFLQGDVIIRQGERGYTMYIITAGKVRIVSQSGAAEAPLALLGESDYFGEMALFDDSPRSATAIAQGEVRTLTINKREFMDMLREYPAVAIMMCEEFCRRLRRTIEKVGV